MSKLVRSLSNDERQQFTLFFENSTLDKAQIIEGYVPFWLRKRMCAVVIGRRIYFRAGVYQENTRQGVTLLAHELTHVEQFLTGMTIIKYLWASRQGYENNPYELEAYEKGDDVCKQIFGAEVTNCQSV
jgi:hypothetical protein